VARANPVFSVVLNQVDYLGVDSQGTKQTNKILDRSSSLPSLLTLEALYIKQHKPKINTKDEYRSRTLTLKF